MRYLFFLSFFIVSNLFISNHIQAQDPLPKWMTEEEKAIYPDYLENLVLSKSAKAPDTPPRTPGEYEEAMGVIVTWAAYSHELREIVRYASDAVMVYIITDNVSGVQNFLINGGVSLDNISFVQAPFNSVWVRDYGPQSVYLADGDELAFIDWTYNRPRPQDNQIPDFMAGFLGLPIYDMAYQTTPVTATGGNFMADGHGTGFSSKLILSENSSLTEAQIDQVFYEYKGIETYIKMDELPYDNISHLDMHMKLLDDETLLVGEFPEGISDGPFIEANLNYLLNNYNTPYGRPYNVVRIPMAPSPTGNYPPNAPYRTYTNSVILNNVVLVPTYGSFLDSEALSVYEDAMPGYEIVGIDMNNVIPASGAIHCVTREIAATDPVFIAHAAVRPEDVAMGRQKISAHITNTSGIDHAKVFWTIDPDAGFNSLDMVHENDTFFAHIPVQSCETEVFYYISATNNNGKTINRPFVAPSGYYTYTAQGGVSDFHADQTSVMVGETVTFNLEYCNEPGEVTWSFGEDAEPVEATGTGPHEVQYSSFGGKDIMVSFDGGSLFKENFILVNEAGSYLLIIETEGGGTTDPEPDSYLYDYNAEVMVTAIDSDSWTHAYWLVNGEENHATSTIVLNLEENTILTAVFDDISSIQEVQQSIRYQVYPNPVRDVFSVSIEPQPNGIELMIIDMHGRQIEHRNIPASGSEILETFDTTNLPKGIYFIRLSNGSQTATHRLIVQ